MLTDTVEGDHTDLMVELGLSKRMKKEESAVKLFRLIKAMSSVGLLSPASLYRLTTAIRRSGVNLLALLRFAADIYGERTAMVDDQAAHSYRELFERSKRLASLLQEKYHLGRDKRAGVLCRNSSAFMQAIAAATSTGADLYLLNPEISSEQLRSMLNHLKPDLIILDEEYITKLDQHGSHASAQLTIKEIDRMLLTDFNGCYRPSPSGKLVLMTGGTTGQPKQATHGPSLFHYLNPFMDFVTRLKIANALSAYIAPPIYHGYGLAVTILCFTLGKKVVLQRGFDARKACQLVRDHEIEFMNVVPSMLYKMLKVDADALTSLKCIACGGAELSPKLAEETLSRLGNVLYNLYGTSEAGLNFIATPDDLRHDLRTIGKPLRGVRVMILDEYDQPAAAREIGRIHVRNEWSASNRNNQWIDTGDLGYVDGEGYYFLAGRADSMIVSGGENVYPYEVERSLLTHPQIEDAAATAVPDEEFGQRLKVFVVRSHGDGEKLSEEELREWMRQHLARYQMPREIEFVDGLPYTPIGKLDRKRLQTMASK
jgi:acyl-CoA synthetase (AMP-forming)/AMP-acid ligase II